MSSLTGNLISSTYQSLLKTATNSTITTNLVNITDGDGNATALSLSTTTGSITGDLNVSGLIHGTASWAISASNAPLYLLTSSFNSKTGSFATTGSNTFLGNQVITGSTVLDGQLSFNNGDGALVLPFTPAPIPVLGSVYTDGTALFVYDGTTYRTINFS